MGDNLFKSNSARYGNNVASYAVRIALHGDIDQPIIVNNVGSGIKYQNELVLVLVDYDNQVMVLSSTSQIKLTTITEGASLIGFDSAKVTEGVAVFTDIGSIYRPGAKHVMYKASNNEIDAQKVSKLNLPTDNTIEVNFRWCQPGEMIDSDITCRECSAGTYSLEWNSTH